MRFNGANESPCPQLVNMTVASLSPQLSLIERVERALLLLAYLIELDGDIHVPMYEKFEAELAQ